MTKVKQSRLAAGQASTMPGTPEEEAAPGDRPQADWLAPVRFIFKLGAQVRRFFKTHAGQRLKLLAALALFVGYTLLMLFSPQRYFCLQNCLLFCLFLEISKGAGRISHEMTCSWKHPSFLVI